MKNENEELTNENNELKSTIEKDKKEIEELTEVKKIHENQDYNALMEEKNRIESELKKMENNFWK